MEANEARFLLSDAKEENSFNLQNGGRLKNLRELAEALDIMPGEVFLHHVTEEKNDFVNWVNDVIGDKELAKEISKTRLRSIMLSKVANRVKKLNERLDEGTIPSQEFLRSGRTDFVVGILVGFLASLLVTTFI